MVYLTVNPRAKGVYVGTRSRGRPLAVPVVADPQALWRRPDVGVMWTPEGGTRPTWLAWCTQWAADTGCYTQGAQFDLARYLDWLGGLVEHRGKCLFATAPDVVGDWAATWARSAPVLSQIRALGFPAALVAQDGIAALPPADLWDVLFVGGSTHWKLREGPRLVAAAHALGKPAHCGRVNSFRRLVSCQLAGYDSADGTCLRYNPPQYVAEIAHWLDQLRRQPPLPLFDGAVP